MTPERLSIVPLSEPLNILWYPVKALQQGKEFFRVAASFYFLTNSEVIQLDVIVEDYFSPPNGGPLKTNDDFLLLALKVHFSSWSQLKELKMRKLSVAEMYSKALMGLALRSLLKIKTRPLHGQILHCWEVRDTVVTKRVVQCYVFLTSVLLTVDVRCVRVFWLIAGERSPGVPSAARGHSSRL